MGNYVRNISTNATGYLLSSTPGNGGKMTDEMREILARLLFALVHEGRNPEHHKRIRAKHREEWPTLHHALDELEAWYRHRA